MYKTVMRRESDKLHSVRFEDVNGAVNGLGKIYVSRLLLSNLFGNDLMTELTVTVQEGNLGDGEA